MLRHLIPAGVSDLFLALFNQWIAEFFNLTTAYTDDMVVMISLIQFKDGLIALEIVTLDQAGGFKLGEYPVNRSQADFGSFLNEAAM